MAFKLNMSDNGKAWRLETGAEFLVGLSVGEKFEGKELGHDFEGYEFEIRGGSDISGFPLSKDVEGIGIRKVLLAKGWGMRAKREGVRLRKSLRGKTISDKVIQVNIKVLKSGKKAMSEIFPDQNKAVEVKTVSEEKVDAVVQ
mgnify:CR=1 FL=1